MNDSHPKAWNGTFHTDLKGQSVFRRTSVRKKVVRTEVRSTCEDRISRAADESAASEFDLRPFGCPCLGPIGDLPYACPSNFRRTHWRWMVHTGPKTDRSEIARIEWFQTNPDPDYSRVSSLACARVPPPMPSSEKQIEALGASRSVR